MGLLMDWMWSLKFILFLLCYRNKGKKRRYLTLAPHESRKYLMIKAPSLWQVSWNVRNSFVVLLLWLNLALELHGVGYENIQLKEMEIKPYGWVRPFFLVTSVKYNKATWPLLSVPASCTPPTLLQSISVSLAYIPSHLFTSCLVKCLKYN